MDWFVYTLRDARTNRIRYVGMTGDVASRMAAHAFMGNSRDPGSLIGQYISEQHKLGRRIVCRIEAEFKSKAKALSHEKGLIFKHQGIGLMNIKGNRRGNTDRTFREYMQKKKSNPVTIEARS